EAVEIGLAPFPVAHDLAPDLGDADALGPFVDAFQIARLLPIHLDERHDMLQRVVFRLHEAEHFRALDVEAGSPCEMDLVAGIDADNADILAGRLRAVARAAGD